MRAPSATRRQPGTGDDLVERVDAVLAAELAIRIEDIARVHPEVARAAEALREFVLAGGKRVRPAFAWWGWRGAGGDPGTPAAAPVLRAIAALELVQANALLHDDVMDASRTRRGRPTVHVAFAGRHRDHGWLGSADRFGESAAILLGDLALAWADDLFQDAMLDAAPDREIHRAAARVWAGMRTEMMGGQYLDVWSQASGERGTEAPLRVNRFKTAAYTVERPLQLGAALAGAGNALSAAYRRFGADIGVAFQLRDDELGVFGDPRVTGKPAGDDLREGKRTLLVALAFAEADRRGDGTAAAVLTGALGDPELDEAGLDRVRAVLTELGAVAEVERRIETLTAGALAALEQAPVAEPARTRLPELARAATRRRA